MRVLGFRHWRAPLARRVRSPGWMRRRSLRSRPSALIQAPGPGPTGCALLVRDQLRNEQAERLYVAAHGLQLATQDVPVLLRHELQGALIVA